MRIDDWHIVCKSLGKQLNLEIFLGVLAATVYFLADALETYASLILIAITKGITIFLAAYYFVYSVMLTKKLIEKCFK